MKVNLFDFKQKKRFFKLNSKKLLWKMLFVKSLGCK